MPKQLACALHSYHEVFGTFPPAYTTDANGKPLHSWRVLLLPYLEQHRLYEEIRLDEPWDSPHNSQFHEMALDDYFFRIPNNYFCPSRPKDEREKGLTPFQMVIGPDTISNGPNCTTLSEITRDTSDVILFVEASVPVCWMKPEDLPQSALKNGVVSSVPRRGQSVVQGIGSPHYYYREHIFQKKTTTTNVAMADTSCTYINKDMSPEGLLEKSRIRNPE